MLGHEEGLISVNNQISRILNHHPLRWATSVAPSLLSWASSPAFPLNERSSWAPCTAEGLGPALDSQVLARARGQVSPAWSVPLLQRTPFG